MANQEIEREAARPMQFFSHDSDASQDIKCKKLIRRFGMEGYGRWWRLCEILAASDGHRVSIQEQEEAEILAEELCYDTTSELIDFVAQLSEIGLIRTPGDGTFYSESMNRRSLYFGQRRAAGRKGGRGKNQSGGS